MECPHIIIHFWENHTTCSMCNSFIEEYVDENGYRKNRVVEVEETPELKQAIEFTNAFHNEWKKECEVSDE